MSIGYFSLIFVMRDNLAEISHGGVCTVEAEPATKRP
jgi:hypothetical protein